MNRRKNVILHEGEGIIRNIKWSNELIAWSNDKGVKIYSTSLKRVITYITKDHDENLRDELYRCSHKFFILITQIKNITKSKKIYFSGSLLWYNLDCLIIGWADRFKICKIVRRNNLSNISLPQSNQSNSIASLAANVDCDKNYNSYYN